jgi:hypothetical protein
MDVATPSVTGDAAPLTGRPPAGFARPAMGWFVLLDGGIAILTLLVASTQAYDAVRKQVPLPSRPGLRAMLAATALIHGFEARHAVRTARRHGLPPGRWAAQTFVVGFPSLVQLRRLTKT